MKRVAKRALNAATNQQNKIKRAVLILLKRWRAALFFLISGAEPKKCYGSLNSFLTKILSAGKKKLLCRARNSAKEISIGRVLPKIGPRASKNIHHPVFMHDYRLKHIIFDYLWQKDEFFCVLYLHFPKDVI